MWHYVFDKEAVNDYQKLDGSQKKIAYAMLEKLKINPCLKQKRDMVIP